MTGIIERIAESKRRERGRLAALPFAEKLKLLEKLRDRDATIISSCRPAPNGVRVDRPLIVREHHAAYGSTNERGDRDAE